MTALEGIHCLRLYRSGWSGDALPWSDNQLWAACTTFLAAGHNTVVLWPEYGSAAALYRVRLHQVESPEDGWVSWRAALDINNENMGDLPLSWYVGAPSDWPSGLVRYPERHGPVIPAGRGRSSPGGIGSDGPRGVWTLAAWRNS